MLLTHECSRREGSHPPHGGHRAEAWSETRSLPVSRAHVPNSPRVPRVTNGPQPTCEHGSLPRSPKKKTQPKKKTCQTRPHLEPPTERQPRIARPRSTPRWERWRDVRGRDSMGVGGSKTTQGARQQWGGVRQRGVVRNSIWGGRQQNHQGARQHGVVRDSMGWCAKAYGVGGSKTTRARDSMGWWRQRGVVRDSIRGGR